MEFFHSCNSKEEFCRATTAFAKDFIKTLSRLYETLFFSPVSILPRKRKFASVCNGAQSKKQRTSLLAQTRRFDTNTLWTWCWPQTVRLLLWKRLRLDTVRLNSSVLGKNKYIYATSCHMTTGNHWWPPMTSGNSGMHTRQRCFGVCCGSDARAAAGSSSKLSAANQEFLIAMRLCVFQLWQRAAGRGGGWWTQRGPGSAEDRCPAAAAGAAESVRACSCVCGCVCIGVFFFCNFLSLVSRQHMEENMSLRIWYLYLFAWTLFQYNSHTSLHLKETIVMLLLF